MFSEELYELEHTITELQNIIIEQDRTIIEQDRTIIELQNIIIHQMKKFLVQTIRGTLMILQNPKLLKPEAITQFCDHYQLIEKEIQAIE